TQNSYITVVGPTAQPSAITGLNVICANGTGTYSVTNVPGVFYNWTLPAGWLGTSSTNSIFVTSDATGGTISVTADNACGSSTASTIAVAITVDPVAAFTSSNSGADYSFT